MVDGLVDRWLDGGLMVVAGSWWWMGDGWQVDGEWMDGG